MATYNLTQYIPPARSLRAGDILNCPFSGARVQIQLPPGNYTMTCWGAQGGSYNETYAAGGKGGKAYADVTLADYVMCYLYAGGKGGAGTSSGGANSGGFNGGGNAGYSGGGGGGASDIRFGLDSLYARGLVAGGGGGAYAYDATYAAAGGAAGAKTAAAGDGAVYSSTYTAFAGKGAVDQTPGAGGTGSSGYNGGAGAFGVGGSTAAAYSTSYYSNGAGGGGWYGGGAAGNYNGASRNRAAGGGGGNGWAATSGWIADAPAGYSLPSDVGIGSPYGVSSGAGSTTEPDGTTGTGHAGDGYIRIEVNSVDITPGGPMTQLIINNTLYLPETTRDKYRCYPSLLSQQIEMITGRIVQEIRGTVQIIEYSYDYMGNDLMRQLNEVLRSGAPFPVAYLPDGADEMVSSMFLCTDYPTPDFAWSRNGVPYWHNVSFTLREVRPHA